ncbi:early nodulin-93-like [Oryza brachyantha]|uniref:Early nodulin n=1 Tax=Oryza brachyantha TaxID=4533 RepID=J3MB54_ORYBR|nr:early nodulin-93-like [Oryza brachyantha]
MSDKVTSSSHLEHKVAMAKQSSHEAAIAGLKAAAVTAVCTAIPTFASVRLSKWARASLGNPVAKTVIITYAAGMAYFIAGEKKVVELSRKNTQHLN